MRKLFFALLCVGSSYLWASDLTELKAITATPENLSGTFQQNKYLAQLETSLKSTGEFNYVRDKKIIWHILTPVDSTLELTPNSMLSYQGDQQVSKLDGESNPVVAVFSDIFFGVMTAQWQVLEQYFTVEAEVKGQQWQAKLTPTDKNVANFIQQVSLSGDQYLQQITLFEPEGNRTQIEFDKLQSK